MATPKRKLSPPTYSRTQTPAINPTADTLIPDEELAEEIVAVDSMGGDTAVLSPGGIRIIAGGHEIDIRPARREHSPSLESESRALAAELCKRHSGISTHGRVLGGAPHIKGTRVSVAHILAHFYHLGSVDAVVNEFKQRISAEQVKQALAYAHDFMEMACDPSQDDN